MEQEVTTEEAENDNKSLIWKFTLIIRCEGVHEGLKSTSVDYNLTGEHEWNQQRDSALLFLHIR